MNAFTPRLILSCLLFAGSFCAAQTVPEPGGEQAKDPGLIDVPDQPGLPRVLIIGDSISIGYTPLVRELLKGKANVHHPTENCGPSSLGVKHLDEWLRTGTPSGEPPRKWDVIHFNFGLHDLKIKGKDITSPGREVAPDQYEKNMRDIVQRLKATGAKLIWCTTTPVPEGQAQKPLRLAADVLKYNDIAAGVMKENDIPTDDLYAFVLPEQQEIQRKDNVHFTPQGYQLLANQVAATIKQALGATKTP